MPLVKPRAPFFHGARQYAPADAPFDVDDERARLLLSAGLVEAVARIEIEPSTPEPEPATAVDPAPAAAERSTARNHRKRK